MNTLSEFKKTTLDALHLFQAQQEQARPHSDVVVTCLNLSRKKEWLGIAHKTEIVKLSPFLLKQQLFGGGTIPACSTLGASPCQHQEHLPEASRLPADCS
jgi:hypothetical protein